MEVTKERCSSSDPCSGLSDVSGCINSSQLKSVNLGSHKLQKEAADAFIKMYNDMPEDVKSAVKLSDSYRPLKTQCNIFDWAHFQATKKRRKVGTAGTPVAFPGRSNHGWGRAIDISPRKVQKWIKENGPKYGWCWGEVKVEPWHFTFCGPGPNRDKNCDSFCTGKMTVDVSSGSSSEEPTTGDTSTSKIDTIDLLNPVDLIAGKGASDFFKSLGKMFKKKGETANDQQNQNITEDIQRINEIIRKVL